MLTAEVLKNEAPDIIFMMIYAFLSILGRQETAFRSGYFSDNKSYYFLPESSKAFVLIVQKLSIIIIQIFLYSCRKPAIQTYTLKTLLYKYK